jgi:hypothetical protein
MRNGSPYANFSALLPVRKRGLPECVRGSVSDVALTHQRSLVESPFQPDFLHASAHAAHQKT